MSDAYMRMIHDDHHRGMTGDISCRWCVAERRAAEQGQRAEATGVRPVDSLTEAVGIYREAITPKPRPKATDAATAPAHYQNDAGLTPWDVVDAFGLDFYAGSALKYLLRAGKKDTAPRIDDLRKCRHYLDVLIEKESNK